MTIEKNEYVIIDTQTKEQVGKPYSSLKSAHTRADKLDLKHGAVRYFVKTKKSISETAMGGSTGAGSIAANPGRFGNTSDSRKSLKQFLRDFYKRVKNKSNYKFVKMNESDDLSDIISRLKGMENSIHGDHDMVTYGVEDDEGNIMKVTVKKEQAQDFEHVLAKELADIRDMKISGFSKTNISMAELLYNLKNQFNIVDVEFPNIPSDVIYNADKVSVGPDSNALEGPDNIDDTMGGANEMGGMDDMNMDDMQDMGGEEGESPAMGEEGEEEPEDQSVEDFGEETEEANPTSLLKSILDMMKSDAEAKTAQANAAAEESRAKQAEFSYKASQATIAQQEELMQMETEVNAQKEKEKEAKKMADLARYKVQKSKGMTSEAFGSILGTILNEIDDSETVASINKQRALLAQKYKVMPGDSPKQMQYKRGMLANATQELNAKLKEVKMRDNFARTQAQDQQQQLQQKLKQGGSDLDSELS